jgi:F-box-like
MSQAHGDLAAPRLAAPIREFKPSSDNVPPITRLPFELLLSIFRNCDADIKSRLRLTHTSRSWMSITSQTASLWTLVHIVFHYPAADERFDRFLLLLEMQLDRAAGMPLEVIWASVESSAFDPRLIGLLRRKGPFSQWRTLQLAVSAFPSEDETVFSPEDAFNNLESVSIIFSFLNCVITTLNHTTTSRLQALEHQGSTWLGGVALENCMGMIRRISRLKTDSTDILSLSINVTHLEARNQSYHEFPHLETYQLRSCAFRNDRGIDLRRLTTLDVAETLYIHRDCEVSLPSLRRLRCGTIFLMDHAKIMAPTLASLHICGRQDENLYICGRQGDVDGNNDWTAVMSDAIWNAGYLLSPSTVLSVDMQLSDDSIGKLLELSSRVSKVEMRFSDESCAIRVLEKISVDRGDAQKEEEAMWLCEQLTELRLNFLWAIGDVCWWRDRAAQALDNRPRFGTILRIYASWQGEGTYVLLA